MQTINPTLKNPQKKATNALSELHGNLVMTHYLLSRILSHKAIYQGVANYRHDTQGAVLFEFLSWAVLQSLRVGHTLFVLSDKESENDEIVRALPIPAWQKQCLGLAWQAIIDVDERLLESLTDFGERAGEILSCDWSDVGTMVKSYVERLTKQWQLLDFLEIETKKLGELLTLALRFCYLLQHNRIDTLDKLSNTLLATPFFETHDTCQTAVLVLSDIAHDKTAGATLGIWLYRAWLSEREVAWHIARLLSETKKPTKSPTLDNLNKEQALAVHTALNHNFAMITGGPGTGKTFTVAMLVLTLTNLNPSLSLALVAPTGKAAQRMQESLQNAIKNAQNEPLQIELPPAMTIHRLLGMGVDGVPRYNADNPLPYDVLIVDEASMLGVELAAKLLAAVRTKSKLILLGDAHQLSAVEAGAVLADLCRVPSLAPFHQKLIQSRRFDESSGVGTLATLINHQTKSDTTMTKFWQLMTTTPELCFVAADKTTADTATYDKLAKPYKPYFAMCQPLLFAKLDAIDVGALFECLNRYRILCAGHQGGFGDEAINHAIARLHLAYNAHQPHRHLPLWYHGQVIMLTKNQYTLGLFNGDVGICLRTHDGLMVFFDGKPMPIATALLPSDSLVNAYAMTIHKSQGSEFDQVAICLDERHKRLLSRELLYTAVTRARTNVVLYATSDAVEQAITTPTLRSTGLEILLNAKMPANGFGV